MRSIFRLVSTVLWSVVYLSLPDFAANAQPPLPATGSPSSIPSTLVRDPATGRLLKQEWQTVEVPVTKWQRKMVDRTIVVPQTVVETVQTPQTIYVPQTETVLQPRLKGWWNPFSQPTYAYEHVTVTRWIPTTQMVPRSVSSIKLVPRTDQVAVDEPVTTTEKVQKLVVTEVPQPSAAQVAGGGTPSNNSSQHAYAYSPRSSGPYYAGTSQPAMIARVPILEKQQMLPWQPGSLMALPATTLRAVSRSTSMPAGQAAYNAPMTIATRPNNSYGRDQNQAGMPATILR